MKLSNKKLKYSYENGYGRGQLKLRKDRVVIASIVSVLIVVTLLLMFNVTRIRFLWKGYSFYQTNEILTLTDAEGEIILSHAKIDNILDWMELSTDVSLYYNYQRYLDLFSDMEKEEIVEYIDMVFTTHVPKLKSLGYSDNIIWELLEIATSEDFQYLIDNNLTAQDIEGFRKVEGYIIQNTLLYIDAYKDYNNYNFCVTIVNYPFIISSNGVTEKYTITNPEELLTLVKNGFYLPASYIPAELVTPNVPISPDSQDSQLVKVAAKALEEMVTSAKAEGYSLVLTSGYRSYERQLEIYQQFQELYGELYASEYVADPGASEHQTGFGMSLTSQSVIDGEKLVFGDTKEYRWVLENAHKFGFIKRYNTNDANITGIAHEPWYFRYVGEEVAQIIFDKGWTFEEYCLYNNVIPNVKKD